MKITVRNKRDIQQLLCVLTMLKNSEKNGTEEIFLVAPTPDPWYIKSNIIWMSGYVHYCQTSNKNAPQ